MRGEVVYVTKDQAKKMIDEAPGDVVMIATINTKNYINSGTKKENKKKGQNIIDKANKITYQNNNFFGTLSLYGVLINSEDIVHNILFPQLE